MIATVRNCIFAFLVSSFVGCGPMLTDRGLPEEVDKLNNQENGLADSQPIPNAVESNKNTVSQAASVNTVLKDGSRLAQCRVSNDYGESFEGDCLYESLGYESFSIMPANQDQSILGSLQVTVWVENDEIVEVRGLTTDGINSRWGQVRRSIEDADCWVGEDFIICTK